MALWLTPTGSAASVSMKSWNSDGMAPIRALGAGATNVSPTSEREEWTDKNSENCLRPNA